MGRPRSNVVGNTKRIQVTFTLDQYDLIQEMKGQFGLSDSEVVRNIVIAWLSEKSVISTVTKNKMTRE